MGAVTGRRGRRPLQCLSKAGRETRPLRLEIRHLVVVVLELEFIGNQRDEFRIGGFSLGAADGVAKETLQGL